MPADHVRVRSRSASGKAADVLVRIAREERAGLLVVGNRGMTGTRRYVLGSVPDAVSHRAPCDLLIVNTTSAVPDAAGTPYRKILVATDASQTSLEAVRRAVAIASSVGATPVLFYAGHPKTAEIVFREVVREFLPAGMLQTAAAEGDPADAICKVASDEAYDLVVLGNKGMLGGGLHVGSVPNKVSHQVRTDLLIVRTVGVSIDDLIPGQGAVVKVDGQTVAAYRDEYGRVHRLSPRCAHMGCTVGWNGFDRTWDCPCHGSRYDAHGAVIRGPATRGLAAVAEEG